MSPYTQRTRLLTEATRSVGLIATVAALVCVCLPGALSLPWPFVPVLVCLVATGCGYLRLPFGRMRVWTGIISAASCTAIILMGAFSPQANAAITSAMPILASGCLGALTLLWDRTWRTTVALAALLVVTVISLTIGLAAVGVAPGRYVIVTLVAWAIALIVSYYLSRIVPQTIHRIASMSRAYQSERRASEIETRRRQGARLLHDTVLATLTLLAHSGVGVSAQALREQSAKDAALLRQLRMGFTPEPARSGEYTLKPVEESTLGNTLESVKQRFRRMGLEVNWHGAGQVLLPSDTLDAFLLALAECLENVRRHSGVDEAHVTITDDDETVRAMVTDAGVGFNLESVGPGRLGFAESIVARLRDVGGNVRLFSSPGSGTTVVLEVPK